MSTNLDKIIVTARMESTRDGELQERHVEGGRNAKLCADKNNDSGQTWISIYVSPLSESPGKLLNRVVPNGTLRGVEGEGKISPIRFIKEARIFA